MIATGWNWTRSHDQVFCLFTILLIRARKETDMEVWYLKWFCLKTNRAYCMDTGFTQIYYYGPKVRLVWNWNHYHNITIPLPYHCHTITIPLPYHYHTIASTITLNHGNRKKIVFNNQPSGQSRERRWKKQNNRWRLLLFYLWNSHILCKTCTLVKTFILPAFFHNICKSICLSRAK